ncbi:TIGR03915 family putative DNA repair protein [Clostridium sp. CF011]|uniref:TIGR03915 family putative DNA repair protein n=1 Tax=unclassified Clostridium TaxID=2614128 RepID=UPI001C0DD3BE|nr:MULTISPECIES: TIGR03915 family putative DNA repair protein [unclassified Clostridium]MBU3091976.1 TIGR03915 family putative DNA repair protein [Clostridium sp. CF011]MBW9145653.1 TIGR03915 family putative DNA repair protein [Clostridium sp. CM027]UVE41494.1 TIGR03915 family putative DNA repair protein [Clostridium sp. CM027]WAG70491.1 TIGR03915 family putative DNA repair protein [Clostridium sp. CF011]
MFRYIYDGSFDGFLSVVYGCYYDRIPECIDRVDRYTFDMIYKDKFIETDIIKSNKVSKSILEKISKDALIHVYQAFLSEVQGIELILFKYIQLGFKLGSKVNDFLTDDIVNEVQKYSRKVGFEAHRFLGLVRFQEFKGILYAAIEPTYNILELIANHFKARLTNEKWIIHDVKRKTGVVYENHEWILRDLKFEKLESNEKEELFYRNLWKVFHKSVGIQERSNKRLQMQHMPKKYWDNLIEMK